MTEKVIGLDRNGKKIWERVARDYDKGIGKSITIGDIIKVISMIFACGVFYANQASANKSFADQIKNNHQEILKVAQQGNETLSLLNNYMHSMDSYLSAKTGKTFNNGRPIFDGDL